MEVATVHISEPKSWRKARQSKTVSYFPYSSSEMRTSDPAPLVRVSSNGWVPLLQLPTVIANRRQPCGTSLRGRFNSWRSPSWYSFTATLHILTITKNAKKAHLQSKLNNICTHERKQFKSQQWSCVGNPHWPKNHVPELLEPSCAVLVPHTQGQHIQQVPTFNGHAMHLILPLWFERIMFHFCFCMMLAKCKLHKWIRWPCNTTRRQQWVSRTTDINLCWLPCHMKHQGQTSFTSRKYKIIFTCVSLETQTLLRHGIP